MNAAEEMIAAGLAAQFKIRLSLRLQKARTVDRGMLDIGELTHDERDALVDALIESAKRQLGR